MRLTVQALCLAAGLAAPGVAMAAEAAPKNGTIGYTLISLFWANYQTPDAKEECAHGINTWGPRETFKALFPQDKGQKWTEVESHFKREIAGWFPNDDVDDGFPFYEAGGKTALGLNLDGKVGPNDFTSPDGEKGIDNQMFRALGCSAHYRLPDGQTIFFDSKKVADDRYNRVMIELTGVDSLTNDDDVDVTSYRGLDFLLRDASAGIMPGGSQRVDLKRGARYIFHLKGRIKNGVLTTEPADFVFPWETTPGTHIDANPTVQIVYDMRLRLKLTPEGAEGLMGGYIDLDNWWGELMKAESTHHEAYGQLSPPGLHRVLSRVADARPDPKTGKMTAISAALTTKWTQVFIVHPAAGKALAAAQPVVAHQAQRESGQR